jgi:hypothetical protein
VPHDEWRYSTSRASVVTVYITAADAAGFHLNQDIVRSDVWLGGVLDGQTAGLFENQASHGHTVAKLCPLGLRGSRDPLGSWYLKCTWTETGVQPCPTLTKLGTVLLTL